MRWNHTTSKILSIFAVVGCFSPFSTCLLFRGLPNEIFPAGTLDDVWRLLVVKRSNDVLRPTDFAFPVATAISFSLLICWKVYCQCDHEETLQSSTARSLFPSLLTCCVFSSIAFKVTDHRGHPSALKFNALKSPPYFTFSYIRYFN